MRTLSLSLLITALSIAAASAEGPVETAKEVAHDAAHTAKNVGKTVVRGAKRVVHRVTGALSPDPDARAVNVTLSDYKIDIPRSLKTGKTAFLVHNAGRHPHNFEIRGNDDDESFLTDLSPNETKVLHVHLSRGTYAVLCPVDAHESKGMRKTVTVR
jgi:uncharacterized cupredoxin-like copper-binding protein